MCTRCTRVACPSHPRVPGTYPAGQRNFPRPPLCPARCWRWTGAVPLEGGATGILTHPAGVPPPPIPTHRAVLQMCWGRRHPGAPRGHSQVTAAQTRSAPGPSQPWDPGPWARKGPYLAQQDGWDHTLLLSEQVSELPAKVMYGSRAPGLGTGMGSQMPSAPSPTHSPPFGEGQLGKVRQGSQV